MVGYGILFYLFVLSLPVCFVLLIYNPNVVPLPGTPPRVLHPNPPPLCLWEGAPPSAHSQEPPTHPLPGVRIWQCFISARGKKKVKVVRGMYILKFHVIEWMKG